MKRARLFSVVSLFFLIPMTLWLGKVLPGRWYYLTATLVILETMTPFFLAFETRKPQARELVTISVMCALAIASRLIVPIPNFKPVTAIVMITGIALGAEAGFMTGAISALGSNFFLSQGPWTPWQMMAYGVGGYLAGLIFANRPKYQKPWILAIFGFVTILLVVGILLDTSSVLTMGATITKKFVIAVFAAGFPNNLIHASGCAVTMLLFSGPLMRKLDRLKTKYGMMNVG